MKHIRPLLLHICLAVASLLPLSAMAAGSAGVLFLVLGEVTITAADGTHRPASKGMEIFEGDRIRTGDSGLAQISLADGGRLSLRSSSEITLTEYRFNKENPDSGTVGFALSLIKGGFRSITGAIAKLNPAAYRIQTATATIGVRGTDHEPFFIPEPKPGETPIAPPGTYDKVNAGQTVIQSRLGMIEIRPGEAGHAPFRPDVPPKLLPRIPDFYDAPPKGGRLLPLSERKAEEADKTAEKGGESADPQTLTGARPRLQGAAALRGGLLDRSVLREGSTDKLEQDGPLLNEKPVLSDSAAGRLAPEAVAAPATTAPATTTTPTTTIAPTTVIRTLSPTTINSTTTINPNLTTTIRNWSTTTTK